MLSCFGLISLLCSSLNLHSRITQDITSVFVVSLSKSFAGYTIHVTILDSLSGVEIASYPVPSSIQNGVDDILVLDHPIEPSLFWVENGGIKWLSLTTRKITPLKGKKFGRLVDVGLGEYGVFIAQQADETGIVYQMDVSQSGSEPRQVWTFPDSVCSTIFICINLAINRNFMLPQRCNHHQFTLAESIKTVKRTSRGFSTLLLQR